MRYLSVISLVFLLQTTLAWGAKNIIITDIDDTLKQTNNMGGIKVLYHFLKSKPYAHLNQSLNDLVNGLKDKGEEVEVYYLSAAFNITLRKEKMLKKFNLPEGKFILKKLTSPDTFTFKYTKARKILSEAQEQGDLGQVYLFGDNSSQDHNVYALLNKELKLNAQIYIRDVATWATAFDEKLELEVKSIPGVTFFFSELELLNTPLKDYLKESTQEAIAEAYLEKTLVPKYTEKTLRKRLRKQRNCIQRPTLDKTIRCNIQAKKDSKAAFNAYFEPVVE